MQGIDEKCNDRYNYCREIIVGMILKIKANKYIKQEKYLNI